jgi:hypothetical protein
MVRKVLLPLVAAVMIVAMVIPGCAPTATYSLTMAVSPEGAGTTIPTGTASREEGALVSITATPAEGWEFVNWTALAGTFASASAAATTFTMAGGHICRCECSDDYVHDARGGRDCDCQLRSGG